MSTEPIFPKPPYPTLIGRAWRLRCPRCGQSKLFAGLFRMHPRCESCGLKYEREPGYFLGSIYVNYGLTAAISTVTYLVGRLGFNVEGRTLLLCLVPFCVIFPALFFRYARTLWLAMDCNFDRTAMIGSGVSQETRDREAWSQRHQ